MPEQIPPIESGQPGQFGNPGGTVRPLYGTRTPVMYHLLKTEMDSISAFNGQALVWSSLGSFFLNGVIAILIGYAFTIGQISELGQLMLYKVAPFLGVTALICFGGAVYVICRKNTMIEDIKKETKIASPSPPNNQAAGS